jgi:CHAT domain-containing protein
MAAISQRLGRLDDALSQLQEALVLLRRIDDKDGEVVALNSLGTVHLLRKETARAGEVYTQALTLARSTGNRYGEAFSLLNLGRYRFDAGDPREALRLHEEAAALFQAMGFRRGEVSTLYGSARALYTLGDYEAARQHLERVVDGVEALRDESESEDLRSSYFATKQHYFDLYIDVLMRLHEQNPNAGFDTQALALNERRRARSLLEILTESKTENQSPADPERARQQRLQQQINAVEAKLESARAAGREAGIVTLEGKQSTLLVELAGSEARSRGHNLEFAAATRPQPLELADMKKLLDPFSLLLVYSLGEERSFLWCLTSDGKLTSHPLPSRQKLEEVAGKVRTAWSRHGGEGESEAGARRAAWLSREILGPVADELGNKRLLIVADGALQALPFAALPDPRALSGNPESDRAAAPVMAQNEVLHLPSISTLAALRREGRRAAPPSWIGIVADPVFTTDDPRVRGGSSTAAGPPPGSSDLTRAAEDLEIPHFDRLPYTRVEAESIARFAPHSSRVALDFEASRELVKSEELKQYRILHFATHGLLNSRHPELSGLVLSLVDSQGNPKKDGFLLAHEIRNLDLRAQLVVLSACQTGLGSEVRGEGLVGLTHSFMSAGTPRIVVSLWNVNDQATAELMTRFYRGMIEKGLPPSSALRCAQLSIREQPEWRSPFYWAPFIFIGEWQIGTRPDEPLEKRVVRSHPPPIPDDDFSPPGSKGAPLCPKLH